MNSNGKLRAEWFWTDRWFASSAYFLPIEARGIYREMLTRAWSRGAQLPADEETIRRVIGATTDEWERNWRKVGPFWRRDGDILVNETQIEIYETVREINERRSEHGRRGATARWGKS